MWFDAALIARNLQFEESDADTGNSVSWMSFVKKKSNTDQYNQTHWHNADTINEQWNIQHKYAMTETVKHDEQRTVNDNGDTVRLRQKQSEKNGNMLKHREKKYSTAVKISTRLKNAA